MKRLLFIGCCLLAITSCNLFIEDEEQSDDYGFTNVPEQSGKGYDEPVTTTEGDCEVTYQLKKTVRRLTTDDTSYITSVRQDDSGLFLEIHFSAQTPKELLPVRGQILVSTDVETFPMGCMHRVQTSEQRDGDYCYMATLADLEDTFEELDITGQLSTTESGMVVVEPEPNSEEAEEPSASRTNRAIGLGGEMKLGFVDGGFQYSYLFDTKPFLKLSSPETEKAQIDLYFNQGSKYTETHTFNFSDFSLSRGVFKIVHERVEDIDLSIHIGSKFNGKVKIKKFHLIKGKPLIIGPVVLVLFANLNFDLEATLEVATDLSRHTITRYTSNIDLMHPLEIKRTEKVELDTGWNCQVAIAGTLGLRTTLELCLGLYGKILSLRLQPSVFFGVEARAATPIAWENGVPVYDVSNKPGLTPKLEWQIEMGVFFELSLLDFFKGIFDRLTSENVTTALEKITEEASNNSDWYKEHSASGDWTDKDLERFRRKEKDNSSLTCTLGPWSIKKYATIPWYPSIVDNSFRVETYFDELENQMHFDAQYTIESKGFFANFYDYKPALIIKRNGEQVNFVYPDEGQNVRVEEGKTYYFTLPNYSDDITRLAQPCYVRVGDPAGKPTAVDKGLPFNSTSPTVSVVGIKPTNCYKNEGNFIRSYWNAETEEYDYSSYDYEYQFNFDVIVAMRGAEYMHSWGLLELNYLQTYEFGEGDNKDIGKVNGNYTLHCSLSIYSNINSDNKSVDLAIQPRFQLKNGDVIYPEEPTRWTQYADGTYTLKK